MTVKAEVMSKVAAFNAARPFDSSLVWDPFSEAINRYYNRGGSEFEELSRQTVGRIVIEEFMQGLLVEEYWRLSALSMSYPAGYYNIDEIFSESATIQSILSTSTGNFAASFSPVGEAVEGQPIRYTSALVISWTTGILRTLQEETSRMNALNEFLRRRYLPWMEPLLGYECGRVIQTYAERRGALRRGVYDNRGWTEMIPEYGMNIEVLEVLLDADDY